MHWVLYFVPLFYFAAFISKSCMLISYVFVCIYVYVKWSQISPTSPTHTPCIPFLLHSIFIFISNWLHYDDNINHFTLLERLRTELKEYAFSQCKETITALGECSKREGMLVAINCRDCNNAMNKCLDLYFTDDLFDDYVRTKGYEPLPRYTSLPTRVVDAFNGLFK